MQDLTPVHNYVRQHVADRPQGRAATTSSGLDLILDGLERIAYR